MKEGDVILLESMNGEYPPTPRDERLLGFMYEVEHVGRQIVSLKPLFNNVDDWDDYSYLGVFRDKVVYTLVQSGES